jgi:hypothetical protein
LVCKLQTAFRQTGVTVKITDGSYGYNRLQLPVGNRW